MSSGELTADEVIAILGLEPLPDEGGMWTQTWLDNDSSAIYFLLRPQDFSALHRLTSVELYHYHAGAPAELTLLHPDGQSEAPVLGTDLRAGERPNHAVAAGVWQGSRTMGDWTLLGTTMSPPYHHDGFELASREQLLAEHPEMAARIEALTRG